MLQNPAQPYMGSRKENKGFQDKLTLLPGADLSALFRHNSESAKKKLDLVRNNKNNNLPRNDDKHTDGQQCASSQDGAKLLKHCI